MPRKKLDPVAKQTYNVRYLLDDDGSWFVRAIDVQGAHSSGRRISSARTNIREAIAVALDVDEHSFELTETFDLPNLEALTAAQKLRADAKQLSDDADRALKIYVATSPLSVRDLGELLGLSFQRIQQLKSS